MSKPLIFLFLFQLIISIDLLNTRGVNNNVEISENQINEIFKSIDDSLVDKTLKKDFENENVNLKYKRETIPDGYNNCQKTPYESMLAAKFDKQSSEVLGVKIFKNKEESLNFIKKELKNELKKNNIEVLISDGNIEKLRNSVETIRFIKNVWQKVDLIEPVRRKMRFLSIFFTNIDNDKFVIVYYYLNSEIFWCYYQSFVLINKSNDIMNSLLVFNPQIEGEPEDNVIAHIYKDIFIRYFSILSYIKIHNLYGEGDFLLPELNL